MPEDDIAVLIISGACWSDTCTRPSYIVLVRGGGHTFRCRECAIAIVGAKTVAAAEELRDRTVHDA